ncbi:MAG: hypothetical protein KUG74_06220 [Rhodobacteraceae bacterium]|nr:hypothetical protein [Paracoccaceae bacterium]
MTIVSSLDPTKAVNFFGTGIHVGASTQVLADGVDVTTLVGISAASKLTFVFAGGAEVSFFAAFSFLGSGLTGNPNIDDIWLEAPGVNGVKIEIDAVNRVFFDLGVASLTQSQFYSNLFKFDDVMNGTAI